MNDRLVRVLEDRRKKAGRNGRPLGYLAWGKVLSVVYTTLFRFSKGERTLGIQSLRSIAKYAKETDDGELWLALAEYALDSEFEVIK